MRERDGAPLVDTPWISGEVASPRPAHGGTRVASRDRTMRPFLSLSVALWCMLGAAACSGKSVGADQPTAIQPNPGTHAEPAPQCEARDPVPSCESLRTEAPDPLPRDGAVAWGQVAVVPAAGHASSTPQIAIYEDGTFRRTPVYRNLAYALFPPRGLMTGHVANASLARLRADVAAIADADVRGYFGPGEQLAGDSTSIEVLGIRGSAACFHSVADLRSSCMPATLAQLRVDLASLAGAAEERWRDQLVGSVSLGAIEMKVDGDWPLADDRAVDGSTNLSVAEWNEVGGTGLYRLRSGDFVQVNFAASAPSEGFYLVYCTRMSAVVLDDSQASLRAELLENLGRYEASKGTWLGVELGADRFPRFKNRELAIIPATATAPERIQYLYAIERLDLSADGEIAIP